MSRRVSPGEATYVMRTAGLEPLVPYPGAQPQWLCRCKTCGDEVTPRYYNIKNGWGGCPTCRRARQSVVQRLPGSEAVAAMRAAGLDPVVPYPGRHEPWLCRCQTCGKQVTPRLNGILCGQGGCKWCAPNAPVDPRAAASIMQNAGLEPLVPYPGAGARWPCRCGQCGVEVTPSYNSVRMGHAGCIHCSLKATAGASQRLSHESAAGVMLGRKLEPLVPYQNAFTPWLCRCLVCGSEVTPSYSNVKSGWGCLSCKWIAQSDRQRIPEATAVAVMLKAGVQPLGPFRHSHEPWPGKCLVCGKLISPSLGSIKSGQGACKFCANCAVDPDEAAGYMRDAGLEPLGPYPGRHAQWSCRCLNCQRTVTPRYGSIRRGQGGCRWCAARNGFGFDANKVAFVYLVAHAALGALKVGVGNTTGTRLAEHRRQGWDLIATVRVPGAVALDIEKDILDGWRDGLDLPPYLSRGEMPQGGWTETVDVDAVDIPATVARIRMLATVAVAVNSA